ncbi:alpha-amylase family glycosyl hydrolase [Halalkalibacter sp. AB-rgal2]|uniref:alpha-amylase family glycosyl hydrolase n=1 Tax=Halalkalibacter sp. AB-rgal2 TaxID=3242695 RepID=UPI00359CF2B0
MRSKQLQKAMSVMLAALLVVSLFIGYIPQMVAHSVQVSPVVYEDRSVEFSLDAGEAERVQVAGSFTEWQDHAIEMERYDGQKWHTRTEPLIPDIYEYKFIIDDEWVVDPLNEKERNGNSVLIVPGLNLQANASFMSVGSDYELSATYISPNGEMNKVDEVTWSLVESNEGVELRGANLHIEEDAKVGSTVIVAAEYDDQVATKEIELTDLMYTYTIHYHRVNNDLTGWEDMWIYNSGFDPAAYPFHSTYGDEYQFATATHMFPEEEIEIIPRKGNWEAQDLNRVISIPNGELEVEAWLIEGDPSVYTSEEEAIASLTETVPVERYIRFLYDRPERDYDGWNLWVWGTGKQDDQIDFTGWLGELAVATIEVSAAAQHVGFVLRDSDDWDTAEKDGDVDRFIQVNRHDPVTKVVVKSGEVEFHTVPEVTGPVVANGDVTFYYRDPELYVADQMDTIDHVELAIFDERYPMVSEEKNERFVFMYDQIEHGTHEYTFFVTIDGQEYEVTDPYHTVDGKSVVSYMISDVKLSGAAYPQAVDYNENAVLTIDIEKDEELSLRGLYVDLREVGGPERMEVDLELEEVTIAIDDSTTAGMKALPIIAVDQFGHTHYGEIELEVKTRQYVGEADFDWDEARIYFLLTDRFFDGDPTNNDPYGIGYNTEKRGSYQGGDFQGITAKLDYLDELGINTIWINPIVENIRYDVRHDHPDTPYYGYHGYWASNFEQLNPHFGTMEDFHELIDEADERGMKIMIDVVLNHTGYGLKSEDAQLDGTIPHFPTNAERDRFAGMLRDGGTDTIQGELAGLPDFLTEVLEVREQIIQWQVDWIEKSRTEKGNTIDYFRVDTVKHVEDTTWMAFKNELTKVMPEFKMIGESWGAGPHDDHGYLQSGMMDSLLDFDFKYQAHDFVEGHIERVQTQLEQRNAQLSNQATLGQFLGSHDEEGFLYSVGGDEGKLKLAAALQITAKGQPVIYYGEELGLSGADNYPYYDNRYEMDWDVVEGNDILAHYQTLMNIRADYSQIFSKGDRSKLAGHDDDGYLIFERSYEGKSVVVGLNTNEEIKSATIPVPFTGEAVDLYSGTIVPVKSGQVTIDLPSMADGGTVILAEMSERSTDEQTPTQPKEKQKDKPIPETSKNGQTEEGSGVGVKEEDSTGEGLPNTATEIYRWLLVGMILFAVGLIMIEVRRRQVG